MGGLLLYTSVYLLQAFQAVVQSLGLDKIFLPRGEHQYYLDVKRFALALVAFNM